MNSRNKTSIMNNIPSILPVVEFDTKIKPRWKKVVRENILFVGTVAIAGYEKANRLASDTKDIYESTVYWDKDRLNQRSFFISANQAEKECIKEFNKFIAALTHD